MSGAHEESAPAAVPWSPRPAVIIGPHEQPRRRGRFVPRARQAAGMGGSAAAGFGHVGTAGLGFGSMVVTPTIAAGSADPAAPQQTRGPTNWQPGDRVVPAGFSATVVLPSHTVKRVHATPSISGGSSSSSSSKSSIAKEEERMQQRAREDAAASAHAARSSAHLEHTHRPHMIRSPLRMIISQPVAADAAAASSGDAKAVPPGRSKQSGSNAPSDIETTATNQQAVEMGYAGIRPEPRASSVRAATASDVWLQKVLDAMETLGDPQKSVLYRAFDWMNQWGTVGLWKDYTWRHAQSSAIDATYAGFFVDDTTMQWLWQRLQREIAKQWVFAWSSSAPLSSSLSSTASATANDPNAATALTRSHDTTEGRTQILLDPNVASVQHRAKIRCVRVVEAKQHLWVLVTREASRHHWATQAVYLLAYSVDALCSDSGPAKEFACWRRQLDGSWSVSDIDETLLEGIENSATSFNTFITPQDLVYDSVIDRLWVACGVTVRAVRLTAHAAVAKESSSPVTSMSSRSEISLVALDPLQVDPSFPLTVPSIEHVDPETFVNLSKRVATDRRRQKGATLLPAREHTWVQRVLPTGRADLPQLLVQSVQPSSGRTVILVLHAKSGSTLTTIRMPEGVAILDWERFTLRNSESASIATDTIVTVAAATAAGAAAAAAGAAASATGAAVTPPPPNGNDSSSLAIHLIGATTRAPSTSSSTPPSQCDDDRQSHTAHPFSLRLIWRNDPPIPQIDTLFGSMVTHPALNTEDGDKRTVPVSMYAAFPHHAFCFLLPPAASNDESSGTLWIVGRQQSHTCALYQLDGDSGQVRSVTTLVTDWHPQQVIASSLQSIWIRGKYETCSGSRIHGEDTCLRRSRFHSRVQHLRVNPGTHASTVLQEYQLPADPMTDVSSLLDTDSAFICFAREQQMLLAWVTINGSLSCFRRVS